MLHRLQDRFQVDHTDAQWRIAAHVGSIDEVLEVHVHGDGGEVLHDLRRVRAAFLQLPNVGRELEDPRIDAFHDRIDFVARFDGSVGVLVKTRAEAEIGHGLAVVVQRRDDVGAMRGEVVALALGAADRDHHEAGAVFLENPAPADDGGDLLLASGRIDHVEGGVSRDQGNLVWAISFSSVPFLSQSSTTSPNVSKPL